MIVDHFHQCTIKCEPNQQRELNIAHVPRFSIQQKHAKCIRKGSSMDFGCITSFVILFITRNISIKFLQQSVRPSYGGYLCPQSAKFQNLLFGVLRRKSCRCGCVIIVLVFSLLLSQFQLDFVSFVAISAVLCHCSKTMYVACQNFTLTGPCQLIIFHNQLLLCFGLSFDQSYHH